MFIKQLNPIACKTYLIANEAQKQAVLVDPVLDGLAEYRDLLNRLKDLDPAWTLRAVVDTHTHADHISAASSLKDITGCSYVMHESSGQKCVDIHVADGDELELAGIKMTVLHTPGHTRDSISLSIEDGATAVLLTGDALFLDDGGAGRDDLPGGDPGAHYDSLQKLKGLNEDLVVLPAHDYRERMPSSLKRQKSTNPWLKDQSKDDFIGYINDLKLGRADWMVDVLAANFKCSRNPGDAYVPNDSPACEVQGTIGKNVDAQNIDTVSPAEVKKIIDSGQDILLLDVREPYELTGPDGQIDGVQNISVTHVQSELATLAPWKDKTVITICRSGHRAETAAKILQSNGFTNVLNMTGGMMAWRQTMG
ncbi:MAG: MBL fold metallo-hydrolase [Deltaproteobacteria bacterium]|nr:MBL fold metallo-hydrolase [Deltaproteobacteria bacterium]